MKKRYLIDVQFSTNKKLATTQDRLTLRKTPMKSNVVSIRSYVWLLLQDFLQTEIAC